MRPFRLPLLLEGLDPLLRVGISQILDHDLGPLFKGRGQAHLHLPVHEPLAHGDDLPGLGDDVPGEVVDLEVEVVVAVSYGVDEAGLLGLLGGDRLAGEEHLGGDLYEIG